MPPPSHPRGQARGPVPALALREHQWFAGPCGIEEATEERRWPAVMGLTGETDALAAVRAGEGVMLALDHVVRAELATAAMVAQRGSRGLARRGAKVHVALWS